MDEIWVQGEKMKLIIHSLQHLPDFYDRRQTKLQSALPIRQRNFYFR